VDAPLSPAEAAQRQLDAYNARDLEAFLAAYAPDCTVRAFPSGELMMEGHAAMRARYGALFAAHPLLDCTLLTRVEHEVFAIDHEEVAGLRDAERVYAVAMYEVRDGLIRNVWFLQDDPSAG
jgi:hypothetical protein